MNDTKTIYKILKQVDEQPNEKERVRKLQALSCKGVKTVLDLIYNPNIKWLLPEGEPPYKPTEDAEASTTIRLQQELRKLYIFVNVGTYSNLKDNKRQQIFIDLLQYIHPDDAKLLVAIKDKKLPFPHVTKKVAAAAFPILAKNWTEPKEEKK